MRSSSRQATQEPVHLANLRQEAQDYFQRGEGYFERKKFRDAILNYKKAITSLGRIAERERSLEDYQAFEAYHCDAAVAFGLLNDWNSALEHLDLSLQFAVVIEELSGKSLDSLISKAHYCYSAGECCRQLRDRTHATMHFQQALHFCEEVVELRNHDAALSASLSDSDADDLQRLLSRCYQKNGQPQQAYDARQSIIKKTSSDDKLIEQNRNKRLANQSKLFPEKQATNVTKLAETATTHQHLTRSKAHQ